MKRLLAVLAAATAMVAWTNFTYAQNAGGGGGGGAGGGGRGGRGGNFDPEQMRARMMERYKEVLEVKTDDEWKVIEPRITKVTEARRDVGFGGGMRGMFGGGRPPGGDNANANANQNQNRRNFGGQQSAAAQELQKAIDSKASADTIKTKLAAYREEHKAKQAALEKAQDDLKKVLSVRQEALAAVNGLVD